MPSQVLIETDGRLVAVAIRKVGQLSVLQLVALQFGERPAQLALHIGKPQTNALGGMPPAGFRSVFR